jgi:hypothetical protein
MILGVQRPLVRLLQSLPRVDLVLGEGEQAPTFNLFCPMLSMPFCSGLHSRPFPVLHANLHANETQVAAWRMRFAKDQSEHSDRLGVAGNPRSHSLALAIDHRRSLAPERLAFCNWNANRSRTQGNELGS